MNHVCVPKTWFSVAGVTTVGTDCFCSCAMMLLIIVRISRFSSTTTLVYMYYDIQQTCMSSLALFNVPMYSPIMTFIADPYAER